jgi:hypothetical protein
MTLTTIYDSQVWIREMICESINYGRESRQSDEEIKFAGLQVGLFLDRSWTFVGHELGVCWTRAGLFRIGSGLDRYSFDMVWIWIYIQLPWDWVWANTRPVAGPQSSKQVF